MLALALAACGDDDRAVPAATTTPPTATAPAGKPGDERFDTALWPAPADARHTSTPIEVARSFVEDFVGMQNPAFGEFQQGDAQSGEVAMLLRGEDGRVREDRVLTTIALRRLDGRRWFVIAANSDRVEIQTPPVSGEVASPLRVAGRGAGFEGNLVVRLHAAFDPEPLAEQPAQAGQATVEPFSATLEFERPPTSAGAIVVRDGGGLDAAAYAFAATGIRFLGG